MNNQTKKGRVKVATLRTALTELTDAICSGAESVKVSFSGNSFLKKLASNVARLQSYSDICSVFHLNQATVSPTAQAAGLFYGRGISYNISSVPCGALMRPLPGSRWKTTGSGTFSVSSRENFNICLTF